jgi:hypothetical protein
VNRIYPAQLIVEGRPPRPELFSDLRKALDYPDVFIILDKIGEELKNDIAGDR